MKVSLKSRFYSVALAVVLFAVSIFGTAKPVYAQSEDGCTSTSTGTAYSRQGWTATSFPNVGYTPFALDDLQGDWTAWFTTTPQAPGQWFQVDMQTPLSFDKIVLRANSTPKEKSYPHGYELFVSNDGVNWGNSVASGAGNGQFTTITFAPQVARYFKIVLTASSTKYWWEIYDLQVYAPAVSRKNWTATSFPKVGYTPFAFDDLQGDWSAWFTTTPQAPGHWFQVDMKTPISFSKITLRANSTPKSKTYPHGYDVFVSNDGINWGSAVASGAGNGQFTTITFAPQVARYFKIVLTASSSKYWWEIYDLNVCGQ